MAELKREFYETLKGWKRTKGAECLLVKGARQVGKTFIVEKFARENYGSAVSLNFIVHPELVSVFDGSLDADRIYAGLTAVLPQVRIVPGDTLLFLDEIQECPNARTAMKFLAQDGRCDVVASGSLLGIKYKRRKDRQPKSVPVGFERQVTMHSLSFREYLWAKGWDDARIDVLRPYFERREKVPEAVNETFHRLLRDPSRLDTPPENVIRDID